MPVSQNGVDNQGETTKHGFVSSVRNLMKLINTKKAKHVQEIVVISWRAEPKQDNQPVYNLTVDTVHEYFANGVLVSNCDARRYGVVAKVSKGPSGISGLRQEARFK